MDDFVHGFQSRTCPLRKALERRRAQAELRERLARKRGDDVRPWLELGEHYAKAMDAVETADRWVYSASVLLLKIRNNEPYIDPEELKNF